MTCVCVCVCVRTHVRAPTLCFIEEKKKVARVIVPTNDSGSKCAK